MAVVQQVALALAILVWICTIQVLAILYYGHLLSPGFPEVYVDFRTIVCSCYILYYLALQKIVRLKKVHAVFYFRCGLMDILPGCKNCNAVLLFTKRATLPGKSL
jgi:hypothetical protein